MDVASLATFRIILGVAMLWTVWESHARGLITLLYVAPPFHFTFHGFEWVIPWRGDGMYLHFAILGVLAAFVTVGFLAQTSALLLGLGFTYVFLLEKAVYLNHYYLMCLLCLLLAVVPAGRLWSVDTLLWPRWKRETAPAWTLWLLRFQVGLPYFYGGLAKLQADWLQGQPMHLWLSMSAWRIVLGPIAEEQWLAVLFSWGGLIFDLAIVPLLLCRPTRAIAFGVAVAFHLLNAFMFDIGVFPWLMIGATTVFFDPDWPRRWLPQPASPRSAAVVPPPSPIATSLTRKQATIATLLVLYVVVQLVVPFHRWLYPGNVLWTEQGYLFAWHMMLRAKVNALRFFVIDRATGQVVPVNLGDWLTPQQAESMGHDPEMLREFAVFLRQRLEAEGRDVEVRVLALTSLNGREPQPLIDPRVDLSRQPRTWLHQPYIVPLQQPMRWPPWNVPVTEWEKQLTAPRKN